MVLQGFAWGKLSDRHEDIAYPTFAETRAMAWATVTHGAKAVLYWGMTAAPPDPGFRQSSLRAGPVSFRPRSRSSPGANVPGAEGGSDRLGGFRPALARE